MSQSPDRGHCLRPHTADVIVEGWAPTLGEACAEAASALVESFADTSDLAASRTVPVSFPSGSRENLLVEVLEEVVYALDVLGVVPVNVVLEDVEDGGLAGGFDVVPAHSVDVVGAIPKAVSLSGLSVEHDGIWRVRAIVDV